MADKSVMIALGTKLAPGANAGASQMQGMINKLQGAAVGALGGTGFGSVLAGGMAGGIAGAMVGLAQTAASSFQEAFDLYMKAAGEEKRFKAYFGKLAPLATEWADEFSKSTQYCERDVGALMGQIFNMGRGLGMTTGEAANLSKQVSQLSLDFAAFQGLSPEEAFQVLQGAIAGHAQALTQYGIVFSQTEKDMLEGLKKTGDEAAYAAKMIDLLGQKMGTMSGAASAEGVGKEVREYRKEVEDLKIGMGQIGEFFVKAALGWKYIIEGYAKIAPVMLAYRAAKNWWTAGGEEGKEKAEANRARANMEANDKAERNARFIAAGEQEAKLQEEQRYFETLSAEIEKMKELNKLAESGDAAAAKAAEEQFRVVDKLMGHEGSAKNIRAVQEADELRAKLKKGEYEDVLRDKAKELLKLEEERVKKAKELTEQRRKESERLAEQYGMMSALERAQAKNVLERLGKGGFETYRGFGEKEMKYAKEFAPEQTKEYARRLAEQELGPEFAKNALRGASIQAVLKNEITAKLEVDGPSIARQITERVWPAIQEVISSSIGVLTGTVRTAQAAGQAVAGASL
jgi:hypothetical protein